MNIYLAPLEGVTGHVFREAYDLLYTDIDKYFTPFLSANDRLNNKTVRELGMIPKDSKYEKIALNAPLVPQILGNDADKTLELIEEIRDFAGYDTYNLNFGCPSGTVTAKGRGSGIFKDLSRMDEYLDKIFDGCEKNHVKLSLKTRIGYNDPGEWTDIVKIYAAYPFEEIIIHPRVKADMYNGLVRMDAFEYALEHLNVPLCFNGDIKTKEDYDKLCKLFPSVDRVMIGRGIVRNPSLTGLIKNSSTSDSGSKIRAFIEALEKGYLSEFKREEHAIMRMKEVFYYLETYIDGYENEKKNLKKAKSLKEYMTFSRILLNQLP